MVANKAHWQAQRAPNIEYLMGSSTFTITLLKLFSNKYVLVTIP